MPSTFEIVTRSALSREELFRRSLDIDRHMGSMQHTGERAVGGVTSGAIGLGETVTWRGKHFGIWFTMTSKITTLDEPDRFVDEQVRGPFRLFHHTHMFSEAAGRTVMIDRLTIASPVFGALAERIVLVPYLRRLIARRNVFLTRDDPSAIVR